MIPFPYRGEVWVVDLDPSRGHEQAGTRPCLVVSDDRFNQGPADLVVVVPITKRDKRIPSHVRVPKGEGGLKEESFIKCEEVRCVSKDRLDRSWGKVRPQTLKEVETRMRLILGL